MKFDVRVEVRLRPGIADPQGATIERALPALGFEGVEGVRVGKSIRFRLEAPDEASARDEAVEMSLRLLANPVIEDSDVEVTAVSAGAPGAGPAAVAGTAATAGTAAAAAGAAVEQAIR
ncbi:MAG TPA: phosphoribosylformylglycinamidine synthase subunit PurS [Acidimicrobiales bacterium]|nr:phosphoribosylformylglycinamidine synthase subunit PurS [Acidimicrobiales bacterium]